MKKTISCATSCYGYQINLESTLKDIALLGFDGVELMSIPTWFDHISPETHDPEELRKIKRLVDELQLATPAMSAHCELGKAGGAGQLIARLELAAFFGIKLILSGAGNLEGIKEETTFYKSIEETLPYAEKFGITLLLETGGTFLSTGDKTRIIIERFNSHWLQMAYDPANVACWGNADPSDDVKKVLEHIKHVHIKDYKAGLGWHPPLGEGQVDFDSFFYILKEYGYTGNFSIEVDLKDGSFDTAHTHLKQSLSYLHQKTNFNACFGNQKQLPRVRCP